MPDTKVKILIVDDEPKVIRFVEISLKLSGYSVTTLESGQEAIDMFAAIQPDLLLLDIIMPEVDGFMVLDQLRKVSSIPVIAYSASELNRQKALACGADEFVAKPFYPDEIIDRVNTLLDR